LLPPERARQGGPKEKKRKRPSFKFLAVKKIVKESENLRFWKGYLLLEPSDEKEALGLVGAKKGRRVGGERGGKKKPSRSTCVRGARGGASPGP